ncbi:MAG: dGTP triphosphohydrolase, partial [Bacteroidota bacterium]
SIFVHNRLTHSLEVASVGRSIANRVAMKLQNRADISDKDILNELHSIVGAACLCHDMGNPPFGHAGEDAISKYFEEGAGKHLKHEMPPEEWNDMVNFEGNANALRLLTHQFRGRREGGFALTYTTLASLIKYPYGSELNTRKYGYFQSEKHTFQKIANELDLEKISEAPLKYARHPLVYIVEAADDICYEIMDIEDAHKLNILDRNKTFDLLLSFFDGQEDKAFLKRKDQVFREVTDLNEQVAYLRASVINKLVTETADIFLAFHDCILQGDFNSSLIDRLEGRSQQAFKACKSLAFREIYNHRSVVKIELTGFNVLGTLLEEFIYAMRNPQYNYSQKLLSLIPNQFITRDESTVYEKVRSVLDFVSGMTDLYAVDLYRDIKGISI